METLLALLALPKFGLTSVFVVSFISATLLPMGSEPAVFGFVSLRPDMFWLTIVIATLGNTLGGMLNYGLGYTVHGKGGKYQDKKWLRWFKHLGAKSLFFSWLPIIGDPLCAVAGWLQFPFWQRLFWMLIGKFLRYTLMTYLLLAIPDSFWGGLLFLIKMPLGGN